MYTSTQAWAAESGTRTWPEAGTSATYPATYRAGTPIQRSISTAALAKCMQ